MQKTIVSLIDDIDGTEATTTVTFALNGKGYTLDLSEKHAKQFGADFEKWASAARASQVQSAPKKRSVLDRAQANAIREWAKGAGLKVSERGRISAAVLVAWEAAH